LILWRLFILYVYWKSCSSSKTFILFKKEEILKAVMGNEYATIIKNMT